MWKISSTYPFSFVYQTHNGRRDIEEEKGEGEGKEKEKKKKETSGDEVKNQKYPWSTWMTDLNGISIFSFFMLHADSKVLYVTGVPCEFFQFHIFLLNIGEWENLILGNFHLVTW